MSISINTPGGQKDGEEQLGSSPPEKEWDEDFFQEENDLSREMNDHELFIYEEK